MRAEEWEDIKRTFESALRLTETERVKYLDAACGQNAGVRQTVEELLRAHREASGFLDEDALSPQLKPVFAEGQLVADRFRVIRLISRGGMGEVYEVFDERLTIKLALKTLRPEYASDRDALERFRREIRVTRDFGHPNLCRVYELVEHDPGGGVVTCLTMQLIGGETLQQYLARAGPLSPQAALPLVQQMAAAVGVLHANGIIHRDLKPSNIMIVPGRDGELRAIVMDFGLAKPFDANRDLFESKSDFHAGAPFYLAPELLKGEKPSVASDIYALGLIIDEMVTTGSAFSADSVEALLYQKLWNEPKDPQTRALGLPYNWRHAILRCLERDPGKRYGAAGEIPADLSLDIDDSTRPLPFLYRARQVARPWASILVRRSRAIRWRAALWFFLAVMLAGGAALGYIISRPLETTVRILRFENSTDNPNNNYLSQGTALEIERRLLQIPGVDVYKEYEQHPEDASLKPAERFSIGGLLQNFQSHTRLSVRVIDNRTGRIAWANDFETENVNPLAMETEIASGAVNAMRDEVLFPRKAGTEPSLLASSVRWLLRQPLLQPQIAGPTKSATAFEFYMRGRTLVAERSPAAAREAKEQLERALQLDDHFALAYADLAGVELTLMQDNTGPQLSLLEAARGYAEQAVANGPEYSESYTARAAVRQAQWDWRGAEQDYKKAIDINSKFALAHRWYGGLLIQFGRFDEGLREAQQAIDLDRDDYAGRFSLGTYLFYAEQPQKAAEYLEGLLKKNNYPGGHYNLAYVYVQLGVLAEGSSRNAFFARALSETNIAAQTEPRLVSEDTNQFIPLFALIYALRGERSEAQRYFSELLAEAQSGSASAADLADTYVALGDYQAALDALERGVKEKDPGLLYIKVDPLFAPLRGMAKYKSLISQTGL